MNGKCRNDSGTGAYQTIYRGSTNLGDATYGFHATTGIAEIAYYSFLDSPSTTSAITYQVYYRNGTGNTARFNFQDSGNDGSALLFYKSSITAIEIKG